MANRTGRPAGREAGNGLREYHTDSRPEVFVIGGGVSKAGDILLDAIKKHYGTYTFGAVKEGKFILASLGNDAGIYGAARLIKGE